MGTIAEFHKNELIRMGSAIFRVLAVKDELLLIDCIKKTMPKWYASSRLCDGTICSEHELLEQTGIVIRKKDELTLEESKIMSERFRMITGVLVLLDDDRLRNAAIIKAAEESGVSRKTIRNYLCLYLAFQEKTILAPKAGRMKKELSDDQKNIRWALNKFYYTRHGNSLPDAYIMMLREKYSDAEGKLLPEHPSIHQFKYFYRCTKSLRKEYISRGGIKDYEMNHRPLLGDGVRQFAPAIGVGMVDTTLCDIYLCDAEGNLLPRPLLAVCVDAYSSMCMGYALLWEGGTYSIQELLFNIISNKVEWCGKFGISISKEEWDCTELPGTFVTDMGSEFKSYQFEQVTELGCRIVNLPAYRPELKGPVEKVFDLIQDSYKPYLKGKGVIDVDFRKRGARDYRLDACLTIEAFEKIIIHCIIYHNTKRLLENFPYNEDMLEAQVPPYANAVWNNGKAGHGADLISVGKKELMLTLLPRGEARFTRRGLVFNKLRYQNKAYVEEYLKGGKVTVAYNPDNVNAVYLVEDRYAVFELIESRFADRTLEETLSMRKKEQEFIKSHEEETLKAKVELAGHIEAIASQYMHRDIKIKSVRETKQKEKNRRHRNRIGEEDMHG